MIADVQIRLGGNTALKASLGYGGIIARGLGLWRTPRRGDFRDAADSDFSISDTLEKATVVFQVPGYSPSELLLEVTPHWIRLRNSEVSTASRRGDSLDRLVQLAEAVEPERVEATLKDGLLTVDLPKAAWIQGKARRVPVKVGPSVAAAQQKDQPENHP